MSNTSDIFITHSDILEDYKNYIQSFINIYDDDIREKVRSDLESGKLWPEALIQFNPAFEVAGDINTLVEQESFDPSLSHIFKGYRLFRHQVEAMRLGCSNKDFVVTSGTGSGKSVTYIGTIFNSLMSTGATEGGVKAVIVYPMNALINSQSEEIEKYKKNFEETTGNDFPIRVAQYTGQEDEELRSALKKNPPDVLLTNYMMLELILSRSNDIDIKTSIYENMQHLVFDELHTYRGRQGADVAMLIRRLRASCKHQICCMGTSATMISGDDMSLEQQKQSVASVASDVFGVDFKTDQIINETLAPSFGSYDPPDSNALKKAITAGIDMAGNSDDVKKHPTAQWLESEVALTEKESVLIRNKPLPMHHIVSLLANKADVPEETALDHLKDFLCWLGDINHKLGLSGSQERFLPFKLHQFISQTGSVYVTLESPGNREITLEPGVYAITDDKNSKKPLYPVVFSRTSGSSFICVTRNFENHTLDAREFNAGTTEDGDEGQESNTDGYIFLGGDDVWNPSEDLEQLPEAWINRNKKDEITGVKKKYADRIPARIYFDETGKFSMNKPLQFEGWFMPVKLLFDPTSGATFDPKTSEYAKLTRLGSEGRSTSTTITTFAILQRMANSGYDEQSQKLLSFTDNRQDAALQAGHFNDFINVVQIRAGIYHALRAAEGHHLNFQTLPRLLAESLNLPFTAYANQDTPPRFENVKKKYDDTFQTYLFYRALYDLRRGWRVVLPNLEQCGLLNIDYEFLEDNCAKDDLWADIPMVNSMTSENRKDFIQNVLDYFRLSYALYSENYLTEDRIYDHHKEINERLRQPWKFDEKEEIVRPVFMRLGTVDPRSKQRTQSIGPTSRLGKYLKSIAAKLAPELDLSKEQYAEFVSLLMDRLCEADYLKRSTCRDRDNAEIPVYQLNITQLIWRLGDGETTSICPVLMPSYKSVSQQPNRFFKDVYKTDFSSIKTLKGQDHTGQLNNADRKQRESEFKAGTLSALYCSPTMELGIDISSLNIVHMRNVPPSPANYAQRSGRAGRSGQPALVFTYCSSYSSHDRHYFRYQQDMVAGSVAPPKIDLCNAELLRTHLNALYISEYGLPGLEYSIEDLLNQDAFPDLPLSPATQDHLSANEANRNRVRALFVKVIHDFSPELQNGFYPWFTSDWIDRNINDLSTQLNKAINRWRTLFVYAKNLLESSTDKIKSGLLAVGSRESKLQKANQHQAQLQLDILRNKPTKGKSKRNSEFYPWRYLAAEGFLPGYNFTRLPLSAYIPITSEDGDYISRPRAIALREFGPGNRIYHNGRKFVIKQMIVRDAENQMEKAKVCISSGYYLTGEQYERNLCPFTQRELDNAETVEFFQNLLEMASSETVRKERITCEEEERISRGYDVQTYFSVDQADMSNTCQAILKNDEETFMNLTFIPAARLVYVNKRWRARSEKGFPIGLTSGIWKTVAGSERTSEESEQVASVQLYTTDVADAVYLEPIEPLGLEREGIITLQYALKKAVENVFQVESSEISVASMGKPENPNVFLYESSEGSLGILSQFVDSPDIFRKVVEEAIKICRFDEEDYQDAASYDDLLSYYNQRDHKIIDRFLIKDALNKLLICSLEINTNRQYQDYDEQYRILRESIDPNSSTEREFLDYLYKNDLRLPDLAQKRVDGVFVQPDFYYEKNIHIFCDGTPHDKPSVKEDDEWKRQQIISLGHEVLVYYYKDDLAEFVKKRSDIFRKVR